jgi:hypothetical protein
LVKAKAPLITLVLLPCRVRAWLDADRRMIESPHYSLVTISLLLICSELQQRNLIFPLLNH